MTAAEALMDRSKLQRESVAAVGRRCGVRGHTHRLRIAPRLRAAERPRQPSSSNAAPPVEREVLQPQRLVAGHLNVHLQRSHVANNRNI